MHSSILYDRFTTLPTLRGHFHRPRIDLLLNDLLDRRLITVTAGAGWGKTHAVSAFLRNTNAHVIWLQLSALDNHASRFWEEFVYIMEYQNKETAEQLNRLGFPDTLAKFDTFLHIMAKEIYAREQVIFVFDDFHLIQDESVARFMQNLVIAKLENLCIIINSRIKPGFNEMGLPSNEVPGGLTAQDLCFTLDETEEYLTQQGVTLSVREYKKVHASTEGWPMALYLVGLSLKKSGLTDKDPLAGAMPIIFDMIETEVYSTYTPLVQNFLVRTSLLNVFPEGLIKEMAAEAYTEISESLENNMFIQYNPYTRQYNLHHLFLDFLTEKQRLLPPDSVAATYMQAADWCSANDQRIEALGYYDKCGRYDRVMDIIVYDHNNTPFTKTMSDYYLSIMDKIPEDIKEKNPMFYVNYAGLLLNNAEIQPAIQQLMQTRAKLEPLPLTKDNRYTLGNIYFMLGLLSLASGTYDFVELMQKASEYLPDGGFTGREIGPVNTKYAIMLNSPAPGALQKMEEALFTGMPYASKAMDGYGYGVEYLASAEAAYFTGDMKKATKNAYEAIYKAREKHIEDIVSSAYFLLMRIEAANGNYAGVMSHLEQFRAYMEGIEGKFIFSEMLDVAEGWFYIVTGQLDKVAVWIVDDTAGNVLPPFSMGMERLIKARYLLKKGRYYELLAWLGQSEELFRRYGMWLILLDMLIYKAIASHYVQDEEQSMNTLREAYDIAHGNNLITQFAEFGNDIRNVLYSAKHSAFNTVPDAWLDEMYTKSSTYEKHLRAIVTQHNQRYGGQAAQTDVKLTKRERELLAYLCQGLTNAEIASTCFITVSAVKKTLNNIYIKLGATNRADAVRTAIQTGLCG